jgi:integrase
MRRFYLHQRSGIYYAQLIDPKTHKCLTARSTGQKDPDEARLVVLEWLRSGVPSGAKGRPRPSAEVFTTVQLLEGLRTATLGREEIEKIVSILKGRGLIVSAVVAGAPGAVLFDEYLRTFWSYERSPYVKDLQAVERRMGRTHCSECLGRVEKYWAPYFKGRYLSEITRSDLKTFRLHLAAPEFALSPLTRNHILNVGTKALKWAAANDLIKNDPTVGLARFAGKAKKRGVLTPEEASALFKLDWKDERVKLVNRIAATTGLRVGEILALRADDIAERWLWVRHSFSLKDGLKTTKTGAERRVPILPEIRAQLVELARLNPDGYIFPKVLGNEAELTKLSDKEPMYANLVLSGLQDALVRLSLGEKYPTATAEEKDMAAVRWKTRSITVHSWRHYYAARMNDKIEARLVMLGTGHATEAVFKEYADHALESDFTELEEATQKVFADLLPLSLPGSSEEPQSLMSVS